MQNAVYVCQDLSSNNFVNQGNTHKKTSEVFNIGTAAMEMWLELFSETGSLEKRPLNRSAPIFESEKIQAYIELES